MERFVDLRNINKSYPIGAERLHILKDVSFSVDKGEYLAILGPSGSGKSTLMNIIGCMDTLDSGEYFLDGEAIHEYGDKELTGIRNRKIGFIFQKYHLIPQYTALQNVIMPLLLRGVSRDEAVAEAEKCIRLVGLEDRIKHRPNELSGGQQQRIAIARALVTQPALLLADEPTGALDSVTGQEILKLFRELNEAGNTIIMITHDINIAKASRRMLKLYDGRLGN